jgi:hypothetical protein
MICAQANCPVNGAFNNSNHRPKTDLYDSHYLLTLISGHPSRLSLNAQAASPRGEILFPYYIIMTT